MKRLLGFVIICILLLQGFAAALTGIGYPAWDGAAPVENALAGSIDGADIRLEFDASADHSARANGYVQACFFAYDADQKNYIDLYLCLPETVAAGDVIAPQTADADGFGGTFIELYEVFENDDEIRYLAGQLGSLTYPVGSSYTITIDSAQTADGKITLSGRLDAVLVDGAGAAQNVIIGGAQFHFALPLADAPAAAPMPTAAAPKDCVKV